MTAANPPACADSRETDEPVPLKMLKWPAALCLLAVLPAAAGGEDNRMLTFSGAIQTGLAETFQLTLGGRFAETPVWQNRVTLHLDNVLRPGDRVSLTGWNSFALRDPSRDWLAGLSYRPTPLRSRAARSSVSFGAGVQRWRFPSVRKDAQDWLFAADASWQGQLPLSPWAQSEYWYNAHSSLPTGSLLYSQGGTQHRLYQREHVQLSYRHGVAYTYVWGFYGKQGGRVVRYVGTLVMSWRKNSVEAGVRPQHALQPGIPNNVFWTLNYVRRF